MPISCQLDRLLERRGIPLEKVALAVGVTERAVRNWLRGEVPSAARIEGLCDALDCQPGDILIFRRPTHLVFTAGYEGDTLEGLLSRLLEARVEEVVDTRLTPISRKRGLSKSALRAALDAAGIRYTHIPALGTPKAVRVEYYRTGDWEPLALAYERQLDDLEDPIQEVAALARTRRTCLLCFERDHDRCHRGLLAGRLAKDHGLEVCHL